MNNRHSLFALAMLAALWCPPGFAHEGHDDHETPAAAVGEAQPRFAAVSDAYELVGVVNGHELTVYLDRFEDNAPVTGAQVELSLGGTKVALKEHAAGEFEGEFEPSQPGHLPVKAAITVGQNRSELTGEFDMPGDAHDHEGHDHAGQDRIDWRSVVAWATGGAVLLALAGAFVRRTRAGGAA